MATINSTFNYIQRYVASGVDFNAGTTDTLVPISLPVSGASRYKVASVYICNASHTLITATIGVFTAAAGGGVAIAADQAITVSATAANTNNNMQTVTLTAATTTYFTAPILYVRIGTAEGAAATADVAIVLELLS